MSNCKSCAHSIFDEKWGEYKCKILQRRIYILSSMSKCPNYKEKGAEKNAK